MRVLIVDDEAPARTKLRRLLRETGEVTVVGEAASGAEAVARIRELAPDLVLLDIHMPQLDGFGVVQEIGADAMPPVVFVTAYDAHALRAFEVHALDYLLKPVAPERFHSTMQRARRLIEREADVDGSTDAPLADRLRALLDEVGAAARYVQHLLVHQSERALLVPVDRLVRIVAERNYVRLCTPDGEYMLRSTISDLEQRLDPSAFLRVNRSQIVRLDAIREMHPWSHGDYHVVLRDGRRVVWSRRYRARSAHQFGV